MINMQDEYDDINFIVIFRDCVCDNWEISTFNIFSSAYGFFVMNPCRIKKILEVSEMVDFRPRKEEIND